MGTQWRPFFGWVFEMSADERSTNTLLRDICTSYEVRSTNTYVPFRNHARGSTWRADHHHMALYASNHRVFPRTCIYAHHF